ncbi:MAG: HAMP domain-containing histidine kinase [Bdellovibrionaceae bacterium]|nr:HAMP domain-containing histidine kinase [Pseudobdellovibrionaceae bacterium]
MRRASVALLIRLFMSFLVTALVTSGLVFMLVRSFRPAGGLNSVVEKNLDFYLTSLHEKIGPDFTIEKAKTIAEKLGLHVQFEDFRANPELPSLSVLKPEIEGLAPRYTIGKERGYFYAVHEGLSPRVAWMIKMRDLPRGFQMTFVSILGFLLALLVMSFISVHVLMKPFRVVLGGIEQIASGNIKYRLPERYRHGFAAVVDRFNLIADQLERYILSKDRLLRDVSHELRSPLTRMTVAIDMLEESNLKTSLKNDSQIMNRLIRDILESYRVQKSKVTLRKVNIADVLNSLVYYYESAELIITCQGPADLTWSLDANLIEVIVKNLIENSIKYVDKNPVKIEIYFERRSEVLHLTITDNGPGIPGADLPYIFEPFYRSAHDRQQVNPDGFGLGLAIVKSYTELQNGQITVRNLTGGGAQFVLEFPS